MGNYTFAMRYIAQCCINSMTDGNNAEKHYFADITKRKKVERMRLIDADYLEMVMTEDWFLHILINEDNMQEAIKNCIDSVPLAYDIKKVVTELDEQARKSLEKYKESFELYQEEYWHGNMNGFGKAIEIVRKGGVDNAG